MRITITIDDALKEMIQELATIERRSLSGQISHMLATAPAVVGGKAIKKAMKDHAR